MPRRSIIQQYLDENDKTLGKYNAAIGGYNAENADKTARYNAKVGEHNAFLEEIKGGATGLYNSGGTGQNESGQVLKKLTPDELAQQNRYYDFVNQKQAELDNQYITQQMQNSEAPQWNGSAPRYDINSDSTAPADMVPPTRTYVDPSDPNAEVQPYGTWMKITGQNGGLVAVEPNSSGSTNDSAALYRSPDQLPSPAQRLSGAGGGSLKAVGNTTAWIDNGDGTATQYQRDTTQSQWRAVSSPVRMLQDVGPVPTAGTAPTEPKFNTLSLREQDEYNNPTLTTAEANLAQNQSLPAKTELANQTSSGQSVFAERDKQENIQQSGILARVLSGQLQ